VQLLRAHSKLTHELDGRLRAAHGLTLEVLLFLSWAPESGSRPVDLARGVLLTQGGITRLLDRLDRADVVERSASADDGRVAYARLTEPPASRLRGAASTHVGDIRSLFGDRFSPEELATLAGLLSRLPGGDVAPTSRSTRCGDLPSVDRGSPCTHRRYRERHPKHGLCPECSSAEERYRGPSRTPRPLQRINLTSGMQELDKSGFPHASAPIEIGTERNKPPRSSDCMACKRSGVRAPQAPPSSLWHLR